VAADGTPIEGWLLFATVRAHQVQASTEEFLRGYGEGAGTLVTFRIYWRGDVTTDMRVGCEGRHLNIREVTEIGRRDGTELRCEEVRDAGY
jgi:SPP1 family predicted phage head-tail adaptor